MKEMIEKEAEKYFSCYRIPVKYVEWNAIENKLTGGIIVEGCIKYRKFYITEQIEVSKFEFYCGSGVLDCIILLCGKLKENLFEKLIDIEDLIIFHENKKNYVIQPNGNVVMLNDCPFCEVPCGNEHCSYTK